MQKYNVGYDEENNYYIWSGKYGPDMKIVTDNTGSLVSFSAEDVAEIFIEMLEWMDEQNLKGGI